MAHHPEEPVYVISVAAELAGMHPQTLRMYERKGLVRPKRTSGNTRRYSQRDVEQLQAIQQLTQTFGVNLAGVAAILDMRIELEAARSRVAQLEAELERVRIEARRAIAEAQRRGGDIVLYSPPAQLVPRGRRRN